MSTTENSLKALIDEANALLDQGKHQLATDLAEKAYTKLKSLPNQTAAEQIDRLRDNACIASLRGAIEKHLGNYRAAHKLFLDAYQTMTVIADNKGAMRCANLVGSNFSRSGNYSEALEYYQIALDLAIKNNEVEGLAGFKLNIASVWQKRGAYDRALIVYSEALNVFKQRGSEINVALCYEHIGICYCEVGLYGKSLEYLSLALMIFEEQDSLVKAALVMGCIAQVYYSINECDRSLSYAQRAMQLYEHYGEHAEVARMYGNIGSIFWRMGDYSNALMSMKKALNVHEVEGNLASIAIVTGNIGNVCLAMGRYDEAIEYTNTAIGINIQLMIDPQTAGNYGFLGGIYASRQFRGYDEAKAIECYTKSLEIYETIGAERVGRYIHQSMSALYAAQNNWRESYEHFKRFSQLENDSLSEETRKVVENFDMRNAIIDMERDAAEQRERVELLELEIKRQQEALTSKALQLVRQTDAIQKLRSNLEVIVGKAETAEFAIKQIRRSLMDLPEKMLNWDRFYEDFRRLHPDFERKLISEFASISPTELKVCCLLRIGMQTREIATLLFVSERTVDGHRNHIRRKLGVISSEDLRATLETLTA